MTDIAIRVQNLSKCYHIYDAPRDRLKQFVVPKLCRAIPALKRFFPTSNSPLPTDQRVPTHYSPLPTNQDVPTYYKEFWALKDVSFEIKKGETFGIIGRNGSGKSTLLQLICGTLSPTSGNVETTGRIAALLELGSGFNHEFTGRENVYMNAAVLGLNKDEVDERFDDIAAFADIGEFIEQPVKTYSSGMMVRLAFAVSVCVEPDILIVDEALAVGDAAFQFKCLDRLRTLTSNGTTLLFVSHDMGMVKNFCHHALYLYKGQKRALGAPEELAELYFLDMRDEQRQWATGNQRVQIKSFRGEGPGIAFGTEEGEITSACFTNTGGLSSSFFKGEEIEVSIKLRFRGSLKNPHLSVSIEDRRMMSVGGKYFPVSGTQDADGWFWGAIIVKFPAILGEGNYHITARLEDRAGREFFPVDKQVGLLSFDVIDADQTVLGAVDFDMRAV